MNWTGWVGIAVIVAGLALLVSHYQIKPTTETSMTPIEKSALALTSSAFQNNGTIPSEYTCDGERKKSPPLSISGVPEEARSLVLIMDDPDVPKQLRPDGVFDHWVVYAIPRDTTEIPEGGIVGANGLNGAGDNAYTGPCPPPQYEPKEHRYVFTLYAINGTLNFIKVPTKQEVLDAIKDKILDQATLIGRYARP